MKLKDYILGRRVVLQSPHPKPEVEQRINSAAGSMFSPFNHGVTGGIYFGRVRLAWSIPLFGNGFRPVFAGRLTENLGRTELRASYGAPFHLLAFFVYWYGFLTLFTLIGIVAIASDASRTGNEWIIPIIVPIFFAVPIVFHFVFNIRADEHFKAMLDFLDHEADLR